MAKIFYFFFASDRCTHRDRQTGQKTRFTHSRGIKTQVLKAGVVLSSWKMRNKQSDPSQQRKECERVNDKQIYLGPRFPALPFAAV